MLNVKQGSFYASTTLGLQHIGPLEFEPKAVIFWWTKQVPTAGDQFDPGLSMGIGFAVSSTSRCALAIASDDNVASSNAGRSHRDTKCITFLASGTPTVDGEADLVLLGEAITLDWTDAPSSAWLVHYMAMGGDELEAVKVGKFQLNTSTGNQAVTGVGFKPDCVIFASIGSNSAPPADVAGLFLSIGAAVSATERGFSAIGEDDASNPSSVVRYQLSTKALAQAETGAVAWEFDFVSKDTDGFTINIGTTAGAGEADHVFYLALRGGRYSVKPQVQPTGSANPPYEIGFKPSGVFLTSVGAVASGSRDTAAAKLSIGGGDGTAQGYVWGQSVDNVSPGDTNVASWTTKVLRLATSPATVDADAEIDALDTGKPFWPTAYQLTWSVTDAAREFIGLAVGPGAKPRVLLGVLSSSGATPTTPGPVTDLLIPRLLSGLWFHLAVLVLGPAPSLQVDLQTSPDGSADWQTVKSEGLLTAVRYVDFAHVQVDRYVRLKPTWAGTPDSTSFAFVYATAASPAWYTT